MGRSLDYVTRLTIVGAARRRNGEAAGRRADGASVARATDCPPRRRSPWRSSRSIDGATGLACYGDQLLTFRAFVPRLEGVGGTSNYWISPAWLDDFLGSWVYLGTSQRSASTVAFVPPALGRCLGPSGSTCPFHQYAGQWATVSAQFDGPVAQTCRYHGQHLGKGMTKRAAIEDCRQRLIVLSVGPDALPATDAVASPPGTRTPRPAADHLRYRLLVGLLAVPRRRPAGSASEGGVPKQEVAVAPAAVGPPRTPRR